MPNWNHIVRQHLAALRLPPEREIEIVEELALCFEAVYEDALAAGLSEAEAEAEARAVQGYDWQLLECELSCAEQLLVRRTLQPSLDFYGGDQPIATGSRTQRHGRRQAWPLAQRADGGAGCALFNALDWRGSTHTDIVGALAG
jgi:hypothetical protein